MTDTPNRFAKGKRTYPINELCDEFGVTLRSLRFYGHIGLLSPVRVGRGRVFSHRDRARLKLILRGKRFGFELKEIKAFLDLYDEQDGREKQLKAVLPVLQSQLERLKERRNELAQSIVELKANCEAIAESLHGERQASGVDTGSHFN